MENSVDLDQLASHRSQLIRIYTVLKQDISRSSVVRVSFPKIRTGSNGSPDMMCEI